MRTRTPLPYLLAMLALSASAYAQSPPQAGAALTVDTPVERLVRALDLTESQRVDVLPILRTYEGRLFEEREAVIRSLAPYLTETQRERLPGELDKLGPRKKRRSGPRPQITLNASRFTPSGSQAKAIFGRSVNASGVSFFGGGNRWANAREGVRLGFSMDTLSVQNGDARLFVLSPQLSLRYTKPLARGFFAYSELSAGPAYMDYTYDHAGSHYGAKRLGAVGLAEVGLRYGPFQLALDYHWLTQPSGIRFDGTQLSFRWTAVRF